MPGRSWRFARIAGIPIGISPWWLAVVVLLTWVLGASYFPSEVPGIAPAAAYGLGLLSVLLLFASILLHELGHAVIARRHGITVSEIDLWLLGGVARMEGEAHNPDDELRYSLAGPAVTAVILVIFVLIAVLLPASAPKGITALVDYQVLINGVILVFNLVPAFPLDGGRVARALLWRHWNDMQRATQTAARVGRGFGIFLIALGALETLSGAAEGLWFVLIGFFIVMAAGSQAYGAEIQAVFAGVTAGDLMSAPAISIDAAQSAQAAAADYFTRYPYNAFPVLDESGCAIGVLTSDRLESLSPALRASTRVGDIAVCDPALLVSADTDVAQLLQRPVFGRVGRAVVVDDANLPLGVVSVTDVGRVMRQARLSGDGGHTSHLAPS